MFVVGLGLMKQVGGNGECLIHGFHAERKGVLELGFDTSNQLTS